MSDQQSFEKLFFKDAKLRPKDERATPLLVCVAREYFECHLKRRSQQLSALTANGQALLRQLRQMHYDDVLVYRRVYRTGRSSYRLEWRVEYLYLDGGFPHFRLYAHDMVFGVVDIRHPSRLEPTRYYLAMYLAGAGFRADESDLRSFAAKTRRAADTSRQYRLFKINEVEGESESERKEDKEAGDLWASLN